MNSLIKQFSPFCYFSPRLRSKYAFLLRQDKIVILRTYTQLYYLYYCLHSTVPLRLKLLNLHLGEIGARRGTEMISGTYSVSATKCCIPLFIPGSNHTLPFLVCAGENTLTRVNSSISLNFTSTDLISW